MSAHIDIIPLWLNSQIPDTTPYIYRSPSIPHGWQVIMVCLEVQEPGALFGGFWLRIYECAYMKSEHMKSEHMKSAHMKSAHIWRVSVLQRPIWCINWISCRTTGAWLSNPTTSPVDNPKSYSCSLYQVILNQSIEPKYPSPHLILFWKQKHCKEYASFCIAARFVSQLVLYRSSFCIAARFVSQLVLYRSSSQRICHIDERHCRHRIRFQNQVNFVLHIVTVY